MYRWIILSYLLLVSFFGGDFLLLQSFNFASRSSKLRTRNTPMPWFNPLGLQIHVSPALYAFRKAAFSVLLFKTLFRQFQNVVFGRVWTLQSFLLHGLLVGSQTLNEADFTCQTWDVTNLIDDLFLISKLVVVNLIHTLSPFELKVLFFFFGFCPFQMFLEMILD